VINIFINEYDLDLIHVVFVKEVKPFFCQIFERLLIKGVKVFCNVKTFFLKFQLHVLHFLTNKHSFSPLANIFPPFFSIRAYTSVAVILFSSASLVMHVRGILISAFLREAQYGRITHLSSPATAPVSHTSKRFPNPVITIVLIIGTTV